MQLVNFLSNVKIFSLKSFFLFLFLSLSWKCEGKGHDNASNPNSLEHDCLVEHPFPNFDGEGLIDSSQNRNGDANVIKSKPETPRMDLLKSGEGGRFSLVNSVLPLEMFGCIFSFIDSLEGYRNIASTCQLFKQYLAPEVLKSYLRKGAFLNMNRPNLPVFLEKISTFASAHKILVNIKIDHITSREDLQNAISMMRPSLRSLDMSRNDIRGNKIETLTSSGKTFQELQELNLSACQLEGEDDILNITKEARNQEGKKAILYPNLTHLDLSDNNFGNAGLEALVKNSDHFPSLKKLNISNTGIDEDGIESVLNSSFMKTLETIVATGNFITERNISSLDQYKKTLTLTLKNNPRRK